MRGTAIYQSRFQIDGHKYEFSTGATSKSEALRIERAEKTKIKRQIALREAQGTPSELTLVNAVGRYLEEQATQLHIDKETFENEKKAFRWIVAQIGPDFRIADLTTDKVAEMVRAMKGRPKQNGKGEPILKNGRPTYLSAATINRYGSKLLKRVYLKARDEWKGVTVQPIKWDSDQITLREAGPRKRELKYEEEVRIRSHKRFREGYAAAFDFALLAGFRKMNFTSLRWSEVDLGNREISVTMKGGRQHTIKIDDHMLSLLRVEYGKHPEFVFTYICQRTRKNPKDGRKEVKGERRPVTYAGFTSWFEGITRSLRLDVTIHDLRRTTGSRILRQTGNLKAASQHLGHSDVSTTAKHYAHVQSNDMLSVLNRKNELDRAKLADALPASSEPPPSETVGRKLAESESVGKNNNKLNSV